VTSQPRPRPATSPARRTGARRRPPALESELGGVLVANAFVRMPVEEAVGAAGLKVVSLSSVAASHPPLRILVAGLDDLGPFGARAVTSLCSAGTAVLVFGRPEQAAALRAIEACGAVAAERGPFLVQLPGLLALALQARRAR